MFARAWIALLVLSAILQMSVLTTAFGNSNKAGSPPAKYSKETLLVKPGRGVSMPQVAWQHAALGARVDRTFPSIGNLQIVKLPRGLSVERAIEIYQRSGIVEYAQRDYEWQAVLTPNDPKYVDGTLYGLNKINAPAAWNTRTSAHPIIVAVVDTGVRYNHEDLSANMWVNPGEIPGNGFDDDLNGYVDDVYGINAIANSGNPDDDNGHGTHCAGTVGAVGNNATGVVGVAWQVRIMALKFLGSSGSGLTSDAIKCIDYARSKGAKVISSSWGGGPFDSALRDAIISARNAGIIFVAAAGNNAADIDANPFYPAAFDVDNIVSVAATDQNDGLAGFSNFGQTTVDLGAPGVGIYSTYNGANNSYTTLSGTSMACPHVSGATALLFAQFPALTTSQILQRLLSSTDAVSGLAGKTATDGRLNLHRALTADPIANFTLSPGNGSPPLVVTFADNSLGVITSRSLNFGDGSAPTAVTTTTHTYTSSGTFNATLTVTGPGGSSSKTRQVIVAHNYTVTPDAFDWIDTSGHTALSLSDDSVSAAQTLPFTFAFYGQNYNSIYVGSNGLLGFGTAGMTKFINSDLPDSATPNNIICPYWDDLNPSAGGQVRIGTTGAAPTRTVVVSWLAVPHFNNHSATFTFQAVLYEGSSDIKLQYMEVQPGNSSLGAARNATIGVENESGTIARKHTFNGNPVLVSNNQAIRLSLGSASPPPSPGVLSVSPSGGFSSSGPETGPFSPSSQPYTLSNTGSQSINWISTKSQSWVTLSATGSTLAPGASTTVVVSINSGANALLAGSYADTVNFTNATNGNGNTSRSVSLTVTPCAPSAPVNLGGAAASGPSIVLNWTDTSSCEEGFSIEVSAKPASGGWLPFSQVGTAGPNVNTYRHTGVTLGHQYRYRVRAFKQTTFTDYSNTVQIRAR